MDLACFVQRAAYLQSVGSRNSPDIGRHAEDNAVTPELLPVINTATSFLDVAAITADRTSGGKIIRYHRKNREGTSFIQVTDGLMEPLCYPMLFPHGVGGWDADIRTQVRFNDYLRYRMLAPQTDDNGNPLTSMNKAGTRLIPLNRFQPQSRLGQHYLVDMVSPATRSTKTKFNLKTFHAQVSRALDYRLQWHRNNQDVFGTHALTEDGDIDDTHNTEKSFLSQSFHGSRRHLRRLATDALTIVTEKGKPTFFFTFTLNVGSPEFDEQLLPSQTPYGIPPHYLCRRLNNQTSFCSISSTYRRPTRRYLRCIQGKTRRHASQNT